MRPVSVAATVAAAQEGLHNHTRKDSMKKKAKKDAGFLGICGLNREKRNKLFAIAKKESRSLSAQVVRVLSDYLDNQSAKVPQ